MSVEDSPSSGKVFGVGLLCSFIGFLVVWVVEAIGLLWVSAQSGIVAGPGLFTLAMLVVIGIVCGKRYGKSGQVSSAVSLALVLGVLTGLGQTLISAVLVSVL